MAPPKTMFPPPESPHVSNPLSLSPSQAMNLVSGPAPLRGGLERPGGQSSGVAQWWSAHQACSA